MLTHIRPKTPARHGIVWGAPRPAHSPRSLISLPLEGSVIRVSYRNPHSRFRWVGSDWQDDVTVPNFIAKSTAARPMSAHRRRDRPRAFRRPARSDRRAEGSAGGVAFRRASIVAKGRRPGNCLVFRLPRRADDAEFAGFRRAVRRGGKIEGAARGAGAGSERPDASAKGSPAPFISSPPTIFLHSARSRFSLTGPSFLPGVSDTDQTAFDRHFDATLGPYAPFAAPRVADARAAPIAAPPPVASAAPPAPRRFARFEAPASSSPPSSWRRWRFFSIFPGF